jgi:hypothetical protein
MQAVTEKNWWERNWKWFVPVIVLTALLLFAGFFFLIFSFVQGIMKASEPYKVAMQAATANATVQEKLGTPINEGFFISGTVKTNNHSAEADMVIPLNGPAGSATLYVTADKVADQWQYKRLFIVINESKQGINMLEHMNK